MLAVLGDSVTTDHISPAGSIRPSSPAGVYLTEHGVAPLGVQLLRRPSGQPRGHDAGHLRQRPPTQPARAGHRGWCHPATPERRGDEHLRRRHAVPRPTTSRSWCWPVASTGRARHGTGRPRVLHCWVFVRSSPRASSGSTDRTSSAWASSRCSSPTGPRWRVSGLTGEETFDIDGLDGFRAGDVPRSSRCTPGQWSSTHACASTRPWERRCFFRHGGILAYVLRQFAH